MKSIKKKGLVQKVIPALFLFLFVSSIFTFILMFTQEGVGTPLIGNFTEQSINAANGNTLIINNSLELQNEYESAKFNYDYIFLLMFIIIELGLIELAIKSPKLPTWNYLTWLFFGTIFISMGYSWIMDASSWFINNYILGGLFPTDITYMPFYSWSLDFEIIIFILNFVGVLLINQLFGKKGIVDINPILGGKD